MFQHWYLDTVKILDAAAVYGEVYPEAVKRLVRNMVKIEPQLYLLDYSTNIIGLIVRSAKDLCKATYRYGVNLLEPDTAPCIYSHFDSPKKCHCTTLVKTCFSVYDLLLNINAIYTYFPFRMQIELLATSVLYKYLMLLYNQLVIDEREYWVLG